MTGPTDQDIRTRVQALEEALRHLITYFENDDVHDEGAFDENCSDCVALQDARQALLPALPTNPGGLGNQGLSSASIETAAIPQEVRPAGSEPSRSRWPKSGDQMRFLGENGYDYQLQAALNVFEIGEVVTVEDIKIGSWEHSIQFREHAGRWNGVMFQLHAAAPSSATLNAGQAPGMNKESSPKGAKT
jgi:hypothetical protein